MNEILEITGQAVRLAEAIIFASPQPVTSRVLANLLPAEVDVDAVIDLLKQRYVDSGVNLIEDSGVWKFSTSPDLLPVLRKVVQSPRRLPRVAMEALSIIAYHQPLTKGEIEEIRGAGVSQKSIDLLLEDGLIIARGHREAPGRPTIWCTTDAFLKLFGLIDLRDLPKREELLLGPITPTAEPAASDPGDDSAAPAAGDSEPDQTAINPGEASTQPNSETDLK